MDFQLASKLRGISRVERTIKGAASASKLKKLTEGISSSKEENAGNHSSWSKGWPKNVNKTHQDKFKPTIK